MSQNELQQQILDVMPDGVFIYTGDRITYCNPAILRMLGVSSAEKLLGGSAWSIFHPQSHDVVGRRIDMVRAQPVGVAMVEEELVQLVDGMVPVEVVATRFVQGGEPAILVVVHDLSRRKGPVKVVLDPGAPPAPVAAPTLGAPRYGEKSSSEIFDCVTDPLFIYDRESLRYLAVNDAAVDQYGYSRDEFLGMTIKDVRPVEDVPALIDMLARAGVGREARGLWRHQTKSGSIIDVDISAAGLELAGRPACLIQARNVTARLAAERTATQTLAALQQAENLARIAASAAKLGGWVVDLIKNTVTWSDEVCFLHDRPAGYRPPIDEAIDYYAPEHRAVISAAVAACAEAGTPFDLELELVSAKKRRFWVRAIGDAVRDGTGRVVGVQGAFQDISAVREGIDAIRLSEERFRLLSKATADAVWDWDWVTNALWWNEGVERLFGYRRDEIEPTSRFRLDRVHPDDVDAMNAIVNGAVEGGAASWSAEYRFRNHDGDYVWVLDRGYVLRDPGGGAVRMVGGMQDLTERKRSEERIAEQATLLDGARDAIVVRDLELAPTYWNRSAAQLYGFEDGSARRLASNLYVDAHKVEEARLATLSRGGWSGELRVNGFGGRALLVSSHWSLVRDKAGHPRALLIISTDITDRKNLETQFIRAQRMESIGTLAGGIAHDLNNILTPILGSIALLQRDVAGNADALDTLATLEICARRGADLVKQVLSFARGVAGDRMTVNVAHIARELLQVLEDTLPKSITLRFNPSRDLWTVSGDSTQLHQVLLNLCVNARDAMPAGGDLRVSMENIVLDETYAAMNVDAHPGPYVMLQVGDTGSGIPAEIRERIFDPFFTTKDIGKGTGLGLSTTLTIVKSHGGFINVYSEPDKGTKFQVYLPSNASSAAAAEAAIQQTELPRGDGEIVLVVDDEESIRKVVRGTLERFGYGVMVARHGAEAVALYAQHKGRIALVLTDMAMPVMDGLATIIAIKAIDADAKIVGSSGLTANGDIAKAVGAGIKHFVAKPYTAEALLTTLAKAVGKIPDN